MADVKRPSLADHLMLALAAVIWGTAFVAQRTGGDAAGPLSFIFGRSIISSVLLVPIMRYTGRAGYTRGAPRDSRERRTLITAGAITGLLVFATSVFQQVGMRMGTSSGKAGFLTSIYIVLVPVFGIFIGRAVGARIWAAVASMALGLWLLCASGLDMTMRLSDLVVLGAAVACAFHIYAVDRYVKVVDPLRMAQIQFSVTALLSGVAAAIYEVPAAGSVGAWAGMLTGDAALVSIAYTGVMSGTVAYGIQNVWQARVDPTVASLIFSLEAMFAVLAGWLVLGEVMTARELAGCVVIMLSILIAITGEKR